MSKLVPKRSTAHDVGLYLSLYESFQKPVIEHRSCTLREYLYFRYYTSLLSYQYTIIPVYILDFFSIFTYIQGYLLRKP